MLQVNALAWGVSAATARTLSQLTGLRTLSLARGGHASHVLVNVSQQFPHLTRLCLDWVNAPKAHHIQALGSCDHLVTLQLRAGGVTAEVMAAIARLAALQHLALLPHESARSGAYLTSAIVTELSAMTQLASLDLHDQKGLNVEIRDQRDLGQSPPFIVSNASRYRIWVRRVLDNMSNAQRGVLKGKLGVLKSFLNMRRLRRLDLSNCEDIAPLSLLVLEYFAAWPEHVILQDLPDEME
jgi:hypothetical protein